MKIFSITTFMLLALGISLSFAYFGDFRVGIIYSVFGALALLVYNFFKQVKKSLISISLILIEIIASWLLINSDFTIWLPINIALLFLIFLSVMLT